MRFVHVRARRMKLVGEAQPGWPNPLPCHVRARRMRVARHFYILDDSIAKSLQISRCVCNGLSEQGQFEMLARNRRVIQLHVPEKHNTRPVHQIADYISDT
jgi:hypothetical protein